MQFFAGLIAILDVIGPERLLQIGENSSQRVERARKIIELLKVQARVKEYELNIREAVADDLSLSTKRNPFSEFGPLKGNREFHDEPDCRCLFASVRNYFDGKSMCDKCTVTISGDSESSSHRGPKPIWECKHGKDWFDRTINDYIEAHSNNEELEARRYAERRAEIDGFAKVVKVFPILLILLASPVMKWMEKTFPLHAFVIFVAVGFIGLPLFGSFVVLPFVLSYSSYFWSLRVSIVVNQVAALPPTILGRLMNRSRPGHPLRKWAVYIFGLGFLLDLLGS